MSAKPEGKPVQLSQVSMVEIVMPNDANPLGTIFGGRVMQLMDIAGSIVASRHARTHVVTASVDGLEFRRPIHIGDAVVLEAWLNWAGRSSMEVQVEVFSENLQTGRREHTSTSYMTFVAVDESGRPAPVPPLLLQSPPQQRRFAEAARRREERLRRREGSNR